MNIFDKKEKQFAKEFLVFSIFTSFLMVIIYKAICFAVGL